MEIEISGFFLRFAVQLAVAATGLLVALCGLAALAGGADRARTRRR